MPSVLHVHEKPLREAPQRYQVEAMQADRGEMQTEVAEQLPLHCIPPQGSCNDEKSSSKNEPRSEPIPRCTRGTQGDEARQVGEGQEGALREAQTLQNGAIEKNTVRHSTHTFV